MKKLPFLFLLLACNSDKQQIDHLKSELNSIYDDDQRYTSIKDPVTGYNTDKMQLAPIEDEANVDKRRKEKGLPPMAVDAKKFGVDYPAH